MPDVIPGPSFPSSGITADLITQQLAKVPIQIYAIRET